MNDNEGLNSELTIIGIIILLFMLVAQVIITQNKVRNISKELISTKNVVYYVSDKLDIAHNMIESLNEEQRNMQDEINEMKKVQRITKELR